jgi:sugar lactone lactonase YvrE
MKLSTVLLWALIGYAIASPASQAQTIVTLGSGFSYPQGVAVDGSGNVFLADTANGVVKEILAAGGYTTVTTLGSGFASPQGVAVDRGGNVFVGDPGKDAVFDVLAAGGYVTVHTLGSGSGSPYGFGYPYGVAVDGKGNIFVADTFNSAVKELLAADGYTTVKTLGSGFSYPTGVAVDRSGNVFVADAGNDAVKKIMAEGGYVTARTLGGGFNTPNGVAIDGAGNVFVADTYNNAVKEIVASGGYVTVNTIADGLFLPTGVAVDGKGDIFVADTFNNAIKEIPAAPTVLLASVLPASRSVEIGNPATIFATMINTGTSGLDNCQVSLPGFPPYGLTLNYQTTNPTTNALTGSPNTPVTIPGNDGSQSFVVALQGTAVVNAPGLPLNFACQQENALVAAPSVPGVNTVDLFISSTPVADVIALVATTSNDGIVHLSNGSGSFAVAADNIGAAAPLTAVTDFNGATLPASATICLSNPITAGCLASPTSSVAIANFTTGATPTFSVFLTATGSIPFNPVDSRIFFRFLDSSGAEHGATSVAVTTN